MGVSVGSLINLRATEIRTGQEPYSQLLEGKGLEGAEIHGRVRRLCFYRYAGDTCNIGRRLPRQDRAKPRESGLKRLLR